MLIVEDQKLQMNALCKIINDLHRDIEILCASDQKEAYQIAMEYQIHIFLVDIILTTSQTGDVSGLRFVQEIREVKKYFFTPVIIITSLEDPKLYSYSQLHCFKFIEKPFNAKQVQSCVLKVLDFPVVFDEERYAYFRKDGIVYSARLLDIVYIENMRRKVIIHCVKEDMEIPYKTCDAIMEELDSELFLRCSRYHIINRRYIEQIDYTNRYVKLSGVETPIEIGGVIKNQFKKDLEENIYTTFC